MENNKKYKISVSIISFLMILTLILGAVIPNINKKSSDCFKENSFTENKINIDYESIIDVSQPETYEALFFDLCKLKNKYPDILKQGILAKSEKGRNIPIISMGKGKNKALIVAGIHAREHLTVKYILRVIEDYCNAYYSPNGTLGSFNIKELLNKYTLIIVPCVNPDGLQIVLSLDQIKKGVRVKDLKEYKANYNGVDLNRNFPLAWESIDNGVTKACEGFFKGYKSGSERETKALMNICKNESFDFVISFHVKGNCIFWGDEFDTSQNSRYRAFANDIALSAGFNMTEPTIKPSSYGGGFENWFRHNFKKPGLCIELTDIVNTIEPCGNTNYENFYEFVGYENSRFALAGAMASNNK